MTDHREPTDALIADVFARHCASRAALEDVASKWGLLALIALSEGPYRFNALRRRVTGVSEKMLSQTLQNFERDGIVHREVVTTIPPRVEYTLTAFGRQVAAQVSSLAVLLESAAPDIAAAREAYAKAQAASAKTFM